MTATTYFAHSRGDDYGTTDWEPLAEHLELVALQTRNFADAFDSGDWGYLSGLWHDLGKYQVDFQRRLHGEAVRVDHAVIGAIHAQRTGRAQILAQPIAGHHAGLASFFEAVDGAPMPLSPRLKEHNARYFECLDSIPPEILNAPLPAPPSFLTDSTRKEDYKRLVAFWIRMIFSALVDADYLRTEAFYNPEKADTRGEFDSLTALWTRLAKHLEHTQRGAEDTVVNRVRAEVLSACLDSAGREPGLFSLTAPTGCGKTLSSMAFALRHAMHHNLRRVLVVLPFTSIIEQNAAVYRHVLGPENVVEHHSNLNTKIMREHLGDTITTQQQWAAENWDAPIIVTTTVQFFESLHANRPSRCRKLHNIARSVIILDEVQTLPPHLLRPILECLNNLIAHYGCSVVLSTATPPALSRREGWHAGLPDARPILKEPRELFSKVSRVRYHWPAANSESVTWKALAERLAQHYQTLAVVDRRADAYDLARDLTQKTGQPPFHLSALMCPAHRLDVIARIRQALDADESCRVVSTQLIEAGVDLDFPVVYRALAGLDHIVQAAGRCNREGRLEVGDVFLFHPPKQPPPGTLRRGADRTVTMLLEHGGAIDVSDPRVFEKYFLAFYGPHPEDLKNICREVEAHNFPAVAHLFKMIDDSNQVGVVCPYDQEAEKVVSMFRAAQTADRLNRGHYRALQPYVVQVYTQQIGELIRGGVVVELEDRLFELAAGHRSRYDSTYGLVLAGDAVAEAGELIV